MFTAVVKNKLKNFQFGQILKHKSLHSLDFREKIFQPFSLEEWKHSRRRREHVPFVHFLTFFSPQNKRGTVVGGAGATEELALGLAEFRPIFKRFVCQSCSPGAEI
jgi:hypothetical protein